MATHISKSKWWRFLELRERARQHGSQISVPSEEVLSSLKMNVKLSLDQYGKTPTMLCVLQLGELKYFCSLWNVTPDVCSPEQDLWKLVSPKPPPEPEPVRIMTQPTAGNIRCFAISKESSQNERLCLMYTKLASLQAECIKEGYLLDVPSHEIQAQALKQLQEWNRRALRGVGEEEYEKWKEIVKLLQISHSEEHENTQHSINDGVDGEVVNERSIEDDDTNQQQETVLDKVVNMFMRKYLSAHTTFTSLGQIIHSIDSEIDKDIHHHSESTPTSCEPSQELIKEVESLQAENDALKAHLSLEFEKLRQENISLKERLRHAQLSPKRTSTLAAPEPPPQQHQQSRSCPGTSSKPTFDVSDATIKRFNSFPKTLAECYEQMKNGCKDFPKFDEISEDLRKCKRTKGTYCKRKAIYAFITGYCDGPEACLAKFKSFTPLQLYEQYIKKSRASTCT